MSQDLRDLFNPELKMKAPKMKPGHEERFLKRLETELPQNNPGFRYMWAIAASVLILFGTGYLFRESNKPIKGNNPVVDTEKADTANRNGIKLGDLSPDLKKIENYYVASINLELSKLEISKENEEMIKHYMEQLEELNAEYLILGEELNKYGPNDQTITAMIKNLQLRLELLRKLKKELNQIKTSKNETV